MGLRKGRTLVVEVEFPISLFIMFQIAKIGCGRPGAHKATEEEERGQESARSIFRT